MMNRSLIVFLIILVSISSCFSQPETFNWYFGNHAGITFAGGSPVVLTNGALNTVEGCASISDAGGNLLFYTDGVTVYDQLHQSMPNGGNLKGHSSSTQSAIIIKKPGSSTNYYIFTSDAGEYIDPPNDGFHYSEVDMSLNSGMGDVILSSKNILLMDSCTEKIAAVKHANGTDIWVMTHRWKSDKFYAWLVTAAGVSASPVITAIGSIHTGNDDNTIGQMKFSPQGNKLALAVNIDGFFELFDFDNVTGIVSNTLHLQIPQFISAYGVEFSGNGSRLYVSTLYFNSVYQFDLLAGSPSDIINSQIIVGASSAGVSNGSLQLATDGKIYMALASGINGHASLARINSPDSPGAACNFVNNTFSLGTGKSWFGLPSCMASYFLPTGIAEISASQQAFIFFNPSDQTINIQLPFLRNDAYTATLIDAAGKIVLHTILSKQYEILALPGREKGIYFLSVSDKKLILVKKILIY